MSEYGGTEATSFGLVMADLAQWFIDHQDVTWLQGLSVKAAPIGERAYFY